ncbi:hypothetical protein ACLI09_07215 [Flavobacterium sp. RHBU_24]|uniref:hypothetical protein n=1 Tax=Flavobacterium sp. RHBU_24 TaxID=3391185 RepID=UPI003984AF0A
MKSEKLKINVAQRILGLSDDTLLEKIANLLDEENVVGYDASGNVIYEKQYIEDIHSALLEFREGAMETYTSEEVKRKILDKANIVGYDAEGKAVTHGSFMEDLDDTIQQLENGTLETYTTEEVKRMIFGS